MLLAAAVVLVILVLALAAGTSMARSSGHSTQPTASQYEPIPAFLSPAERSFFGVLQQAVASDYIIFAKVRLADIIRPKKTPSSSARQSAFNRISAKHVDFILCDPARLTVAAAIELDDRSHSTFDQGMRDLPKNIALNDSGIPLLRVPARYTYSPLQLRADINALLAPPVPISPRHTTPVPTGDSRYMPKA